MMFATQRDILKKLGNPVPQNTVYMTVKALLERMAPVLIDGMAVSALLGLVEASIKSSLNDEDEIGTVIDAEDPVGAGMKLLLVRDYSTSRFMIYYNKFAIRFTLIL